MDILSLFISNRANIDMHGMVRGHEIVTHFIHVHTSGEEGHYIAAVMTGLSGIRDVDQLFDVPIWPAIVKKFDEASTILA